MPENTPHFHYHRRKAAEAKLQAAEARAKEAEELCAELASYLRSVSCMDPNCGCLGCPAVQALITRAESLAGKQGRQVREFEGIPFALTEDDGGEFIEATSLGDNGNCVAVGTIHRMRREEWEAAPLAGKQG